jgi:membrane-anchored mycosin MYCP
MAAALTAMALAAGTLAVSLFAAPGASADSWRDKQYWLSESGITKAWEVSKGANVKVAVIDSGVDAKHPDLKGVVVGGSDVSGAGSADGQKSIGSKPEHGTLVATMLAGRGHQPPKSTASPTPGAKPTPGPDGIVGVAPEAQILSVSTWLGSQNPGGKTDQEQIPAAVRWAVDNGARVINISLGSTSPEWPQSWDAAFLYAEQKDVVIVAAAGNRVGGNVQVGAPATIPGVLTVAGVDRKGAASVDASSQGISIGVAAPAEDLVGGMPGDGYAEWAGTSGATPIVSGVAALIRSKWPEMSASQVINRIVTTAKDAGAPGKDPHLRVRRTQCRSCPQGRRGRKQKCQPAGFTVADWIRVHRRGESPRHDSRADGARGHSHECPAHAAQAPPFRWPRRRPQLDSAPFRPWW